MKYEMFITASQNGSINKEFYSIPAMETSYERIWGGHPLKLGGITKVISGEYHPSFNVVQDTRAGRVRIKETDRFQSLQENLRKDSKAAIKFLRELIKQPRIEVMELDADEYGEAKIVVYLGQRMKPREEVRLVRRAIKEIRERFPGAKIHVVVDYLD
ncbi:MAG: hypothetical protein J7J97_06665 [Thermococcus sp.]|nr:hypothetical protein [Thermococcus sp.]